MPLTKRALRLPAGPSSVRLARAWVSEILEEINREDLVFAAQLGVSELVTNAILHGQPPVTVGVRGTRERPRIEVTDTTPELPLVRNLADHDPSFEVTTFGRGLALVAMNSERCGWQTDGISKLVWFIPAADADPDVDVAAKFENSSIGPLPAPTGSDDDQEPRRRVSLKNLPLKQFARMRRHQFELRRELGLLALSQHEESALAKRVVAIFDRADAERRAARGVDVLDRAIAEGSGHLDLELEVLPSTFQTMQDILDVLGQTQRTFADSGLLSTWPTGELLELQRWFYGEFVRQGRGEQPRAWSENAHTTSDSAPTPLAEAQ